LTDSSGDRETEGPLRGLRVLEVATLYAAPQVGAMLGDLGADVVKLEPPAGDPLRRMGIVRDGVSRSWAWVSRHKRSVVLDLDAANDRDTFRAFVRAADVLVENLDAKTRERWGCTYDELTELNPRLVVVSVSCYGLTGPYAGRPGAGTLAEAFAGLTHMTGDADGPPMLSSVPIGDTLAAFSGVIGALAACWGRDARGAAGRHVDVAMYEPILQLVAGTIAGWDGGGEPPARTGSRVHGGAPRNVYETRDGQWVAVSGTTDAQVARILPLLGHDTPEDRERFGAAASRARTADELDALVAAWIVANDRDDVVRALLDARVPVAPVNDVRDLLADPQVQARASTQVMVDAVTDDGPGLGEHTAEVTRDWLGA
jgi:crotonobetainyl-CoA:carnitine CoA-transferase CaiB-like acyl-CoA transferase